MTYNEATDKISSYLNLIGKPILNYKGKLFEHKRITSLLISPPERIKQVFSEWIGNGNDNKKAVLKLLRKHENFEIFIIAYNPISDSSIYYLRLKKYLELKGQLL